METLSYETDSCAVARAASCTTAYRVPPYHKPLSERERIVMNHAYTAVPLPVSGIDFVMGPCVAVSREETSIYSQGQFSTIAADGTYKETVSVPNPSPKHLLRQVFLYTSDVYAAYAYGGGKEDSLLLLFRSDGAVLARCTINDGGSTPLFFAANGKLYCILEDAVTVYDETLAEARRFLLTGFCGICGSACKCKTLR